MNQNTPFLYDGTSRALHWVTAIVVTIAFILGPGGFGRLIHEGVDPATRSDIVWHESLGIAVIALTVLRLIWLVLRPSPPEFQLRLWMLVSGKLMHGALWTLLLAVPITAIIALGSEGHPLTLLGGIRVNQIPVIANSGIAKFANWGNVHQFLGDAIMWLAGLHAAAGIFHHWILKDGVLTAMLPWRGRVNESAANAK